MQTIYRLAWLCVLLLSAQVHAVEITRARADALLAERNIDSWERSKDASVLAWNESTVVDALLDLYDATGDAKYLDELVRRSDRILSHRDDRRGFKDYAGKIQKRWSIAMKYTVAEAQLVDAGGKPAIQLRSLPIANNHMTKVMVTTAADGSSFSIVVTNRAWKREERFEDLSGRPGQRTLFRDDHQPDRSGFNGYVDGSDGPDEFEKASVFGWLVLSDANHDVYQVCRDIFVKRGKDDFKSLARLMKWERALAPIPERGEAGRGGFAGKT